MTEDGTLYYLGIDGQTVGPWTAAEIADRWRCGELPPETFLWDGTAWCSLREFAPVQELLAKLPAPTPTADLIAGADRSVASAPVAESRSGAVPTVAAASAPVVLPAAACHHHPDREAVLLCSGCRRDFCTDCVEKRKNRYYCAPCLAALPGPLAVSSLPWMVVAPAFAAAAGFGYFAKLYMVVTVGTGLALGLGLLLSVRLRRALRIPLVVLPVVAGLLAWWYKVGL